MKTKSVFVCSECGTESPKWMGKCPGCSAWNTMVEEIIQSAKDVARGISGGVGNADKFSTTPKKLSEIDATDEERILTGMGELDRVAKVSPVWACTNTPCQAPIATGCGGFPRRSECDRD